LYTHKFHRDVDVAFAADALWDSRDVVPMLLSMLSNFNGSHNRLVVVVQQRAIASGEVVARLEQFFAMAAMSSATLATQWTAGSKWFQGHFTLMHHSADVVAALRAAMIEAAADRPPVLVSWPAGPVKHVLQSERDCNSMKLVRHVCASVRLLSDLTCVKGH
jgi:hypothetical protein